MLINRNCVHQINAKNTFTLVETNLSCITLHLPVPPGMPKGTPLACLGKFGHYWQVSNATFSCWISSCDIFMYIFKSRLSVHSFWGYWWSMNPTIWLDESILPVTCEEDVFQVQGLHRRAEIVRSFILGFFQQKKHKKIWKL